MSALLAASVLLAGCGANAEEPAAPASRSTTGVTTVEAQSPASPTSSGEGFKITPPSGFQANLDIGDSNSDLLLPDGQASYTLEAEWDVPRPDGTLPRLEIYTSEAATAPAPTALAKATRQEYRARFGSGYSEKYFEPFDTGRNGASGWFWQFKLTGEGAAPAVFTYTFITACGKKLLAYGWSQSDSDTAAITLAIRTLRPTC